MATRNERKRRAKERLQAMLMVIEQSAPAPLQIEVWKPRQDVFEVPKAIRGHREPIERHGVIIRGKYKATLPKPEAKRKLTLVDGKMIERKRGYFN
jgi:hypothetical protein